MNVKDKQQGHSNKRPITCDTKPIVGALRRYFIEFAFNLFET